jgi:hypothetical protein
MAQPRKRRRKDADALTLHGGFGEGAPPSSSITSLNMLRVHHLNVRQSGKVSTRQYSARLPVVGTQHLVYHPSWYSTLAQPAPEWLSNDLDDPTIYDPVLDEQVAIKTRIRVRFLPENNIGRLIIPS